MRVQEQESAEAGEHEQESGESDEHEQESQEADDDNANPAKHLSLVDALQEAMEKEDLTTAVLQICDDHINDFDNTALGADTAGTWGEAAVTLLGLVNRINRGWARVSAVAEASRARSQARSESASSKNLDG